MPIHEIALAIFAQGRVVSGTTATGGERLLELLGSGSSDFLRLSNATVHGIGGMELPLPTAVLRKEHVSLAIPVDERRNGIEKVFYSYRKKRQYDIAVIVDGYTVRGRIHLAGTSDELLVMSRDLAAFCPITNAEVWGVSERQGSVQEPIVIVNTRRLMLLHVGDERFE